MNTTNTSAITEQCENRKGILLVADLEMRDYFAAKAMQGMLAYPGCDSRGSHHNNNTPQGVASMAYAYADAMLSERDK